MREVWDRFTTIFAISQFKVISILSLLLIQDRETYDYQSPNKAAATAQTSSAAAYSVKS